MTLLHCHGLSQCLRATTALVSAFAVIVTQSAVYALPQGGQVSEGQAAITSGGSQMTVDQSSQRALIDWNSFNIGNGESVSFNQPSSTAISLNRIHDANPSQINGALSANGQVWLVNSHGIVFGSNAQVNVGGLLATSSDIDDSRFVNADYVFDQPGNPLATISNAGSILVTDGGLAALAGPNVLNSGLIRARLGKVQLASGDMFAFDLYGDGLINLRAGPAIEHQLISNSGSIHVDGGRVMLTAATAKDTLNSLINMEGISQASDIEISGDVVSLTGSLDASGATGGSVAITGRNIAQQGRVRVDGILGEGGNVTYRFTEAYIDSERSHVSALGGGAIHLLGGTSATLFASGTYDAAGGPGGAGGDITFQADKIRLYAAHLDTSGDTGGGLIRIGGDYQGAGDMFHASLTHVNFSSVLSADALSQGNGGRIVVWSGDETGFAGTASARGGIHGGNGGLVELSSGGTLATGGHLDVSSPWGLAGMVLLDPKNITISNSGLMGGLTQFELVDPNAASGNSFGGTVQALSTGNVVVTSIGDDFAASNAGAVYLFNGATGGLISTLRGATANDNVGSGGVTPLTNGNYVVGSTLWNNGAVADAGAVTWGNGSTGITGTVSAANSLVGTTANDQVGSAVTALTNGNYVVGSTLWNNGAVADAGAATWGSGTTGITGAVSTSNSLYGTTASDQVGSAVTALANGNYVVRSSNWDNGAVVNAGAATWGSGTTGITGAVSTSNSLYGTTANDNVGFFGVTALTNGNYVVISPNWDNGAVVNAGAATWGSGTTGITGAVSVANSLVGTSASDQVGISGVTALSNGNYVVNSYAWKNGTATFAGAVTWGNGSTGITGAVSAANSLVGTTANDFVGLSGVTALTNGNYVVSSTLWNNGAVVDAGAATWGNGTTGIIGAVSAANSLVGATANDNVGNGGVTALTNGNYVVRSSNWDNGAVVNAGAATWGNGSAGITGAVSTSNSLYGATANDNVGNGGVTALANGNYMVRSNLWDNGAVTNAGAVTWGNGTTGITGAVSAANSLVGATANDNVGSGGVTPLTNGNYVVRSTVWDSGAVVDAGAVTWGSGTTGITGAVSASNSLVGTTASDQAGSGGVTALANGNYVVISPNWDNGAVVNAGAATWGSGTTGVTGTVTSANSVIGPSASAGLGTVREDAVNDTFITPFTTAGRVYVASSNGPVMLGAYDSFSDMAAASVTLHPSLLTATLNAGSNVTLQASNDITVDNAIAVNNPGGNGGTLTLQAGRSILLNADITTDDGDLDLYANEKAAAGVVDANRDAGNAVIAMAPGVSINAGTGAVTFRLSDGAGNTNHGAGDITLRAITAGSILAQNLNSTGDLALAGGMLVASAAGNAITLASARNFINNAGAGGLSTPAGRWLAYSTNPASDTIGGLSNDFRRFSCVYGGSCPSFPGTGNGFLYSDTPILTATPSALSITYGGAVPALSGYAYSLSGYLGSDSGDDSVTGSLTGSTTYLQGSNVGSYDINYVSGSLASALGYGFTYANNATAITVDPATLTVTASDQSKTYGFGGTSAALGTTAFISSGLQGGETIGGVTLSTNATLSTSGNYDVGLWEITPSAATGGTFNPANYSITYNNAPTGLTISQKALTISGVTANDKVYDATTAASLNTAGDSLVGVVGADVVSLDNAGATGSFSDKNVGTGKAVMASGFAIGGTDAGNYSLTQPVGLSADITPASLTVTASDQSKIYGFGGTGAALGTTAFTSLGLQGGETIGGATLATNATLSTSGSYNAGLWTITPSTATGGTFSAANYSITYANGTLTINPASLTVTANAGQSKAYGTADPVYAYGFSGLVGGDTSSVFTGALSRAAGENVGSYAIGQGTLSAGSNYLISYTGANFAINPALLSVVADPKHKDEGDPDPPLTYTYGMLYNGDTPSIFSGALSRVAGEAVGGYGITLGTLSAGSNYTIAYTPALLTIGDYVPPLTVFDIPSVVNGYIHESNWIFAQLLRSDVGVTPGQSASWKSGAVSSPRIGTSVFSTPAILDVAEPAVMPPAEGE
jgi:filamentous hemagglutinin family protein